MSRTDYNNITLRYSSLSLSFQFHLFHLHQQEVRESLLCSVVTTSYDLKHFNI